MVLGSVVVLLWGLDLEFSQHYHRSEDIPLYFYILNRRDWSERVTRDLSEAISMKSSIPQYCGFGVWRTDYLGRKCGAPPCGS